MQLFGAPVKLVQALAGVLDWASAKLYQDQPWQAESV